MGSQRVDARVLGHGLRGHIHHTYHPANSGHVSWTTTEPTANGTITGSGGSFPYTMGSQTDYGSQIVLTFVPNTGGSIVKVMTNEGDDTAWVLAHGNTDEWMGRGRIPKRSP